MKKRLIALMLALMLMMSVICTVSAAQTGFTDVPKGSFYYDAVNWAVEHDITQGMGEGKFQPDGTCNRAQVVTFLWRLEGKPAVSGGSSFTDVEKGSWYADAVRWAVKERITEGVGNGRFQPNGTCNRAQIVTFLWRYAGKPASDGKNPFKDVEKGSWYEDAVKWAVENGITTGLTDKTFGPNEPCNRAQVVTFLYRYDSATKPDWGGGMVPICGMG